MKRKKAHRIPLTISVHSEVVTLFLVIPFLQPASKLITDLISVTTSTQQEDILGRSQKI